MDQRCPVHFWRTSWNPNSFSLFSCSSRQRLDFRFWIGPPFKDGGKKRKTSVRVKHCELVALLLWGNINYRTFQRLSTVKNLPVRDKISAGFGMKVPLSQAGLISDAVCNSLNCLVSIWANGIPRIELYFEPCILTMSQIFPVCFSSLILWLCCPPEHQNKPKEDQDFGQGCAV